MLVSGVPSKRQTARSSKQTRKHLATIPLSHAKQKIVEVMPGVTQGFDANVAQHVQKDKHSTCSRHTPSVQCSAAPQATEAATACYECAPRAPDVGFAPVRVIHQLWRLK